MAMLARQERGCVIGVQLIRKLLWDRFSTSPHKYHRYGVNLERGGSSSFRCGSNGIFSLVSYIRWQLCGVENAGKTNCGRHNFILEECTLYKEWHMQFPNWDGYFA